MSDREPQYSEETLAELQRLLVPALPRYGLSSRTEVTLLNISENATYLVSDPATSRRCVLRVHRSGYHTRQGIQSELDWLEALARDKVAEVIVPIADETGSRIQSLIPIDRRPERFAVMFEFMDGTEPAHDDDLVPWFETLGGLTAKLHAHAKHWRRPNGFARQVWDTEAMHGSRHLWGPWQAAVGLDRGGLPVLQAAVDKVRDQLAAYGQGPDRFGLIHADLRLANLLIDGARLKLLDFDDCGFSWFMYDFASAVSFYEHLPNVSALRDAWLEGYAKIAPVTREDRAIMPTVVMARRLLLLAWIASHSEVPIARELGATYTDQSISLAEDYLGDRFLSVR